MKYIIYMDVFFMVNAIVDTVLLKLASFYIKPHTTFLRCMSGGVAGGILSCISMILPYENMLMHTLFSYIFIAFCMIIVTFGMVNVKQLVKRTASLYFVTVLFGGVMNLLYNYTYLGYVLEGILGAIYDNPFNISRLLIFTCISYIILNVLSSLLQRKKVGRNIVKVSLQLDGKKIILNGLIDSGNSLFDPYCNKPVHIAEYEALQKILEGVDLHSKKYKLVPFHSLGRSNGLVEVIEFDEISVLLPDKNQKTYEYESVDFIYSEKKPSIGLYHGYLSGEKKYEMLLHSTVDNWI